MTFRGFKGVVGACLAGSLMFSSSAALAAAPVQQVNPWAVLTAMSSGAPAATICGSAAVAAAAAAQAPGAGCVLPVADAPPAPPPVEGPPPPPPVVAEAGSGFSPLLLGLVAIAAGVGIYFAVHNGSHANSPA